MEAGLIVNFLGQRGFGHGQVFPRKRQPSFSEAAHRPPGLSTESLRAQRAARAPIVQIRLGYRPANQRQRAGATIGAPPEGAQKMGETGRRREKNGRSVCWMMTRSMSDHG